MTHHTTAQQEDICFQANLYESGNPVRRWLHNRRRSWIWEQIRAYAKPGMSFLEIGIGCGIYTRSLAQMGHVSAFDINSDFVDAANAIDGVTAACADIQIQSLPPLHDLALCSEVLEHIEDSSTALKNIAGGLRPGGLLVLTTPNRFSTAELVARLLQLKPVLALARRIYDESVDELGHINLMTRGQLGAQIEAAGFRVLQRADLGFYLPGVAEFGGAPAQKLCAWLESILGRSAMTSHLLWTQAWVLQKVE